MLSCDNVAVMVGSNQNDTMYINKRFGGVDGDE